MNFWNEVYLNNSWQKWLQALSAFVISFIFLKLVAHLIYKKILSLNTHRTTQIEYISAILQSTKTPFLLVASFTFASHALEMEEKYSLLVHRIFVFSLSLQIGIWLTHIINLIADKLTEENRVKDAAKATTIGALGFFGKAITWIFVSLLILTNLGIDVTTLIAGLGVSGIAVALAVQNILGDLLASLSIVLDKPFVIGDNISVGSDIGIVEHIGLKTTRLVSDTGEQLIFSNSDLLKSRIRNFKRMRERKVTLTIVVDASCDKYTLQLAQEIMQSAVQNQSIARFDRCHLVRFSQNGITFDLVYEVLSPSARVHLDTQQAIQISILENFQKNKIPLPLATTKVLLEREISGS